MGRRTFCCCLPVRLGVFVLSFICLIGSGFLTAVSFYEYSKLENPPTEIRVATLVTGISWAILVLASLFGFIGAIMKKKGLVATFATILWIHFFINLVFAILEIVIVARHKDDYINDCIAAAGGNTDSRINKYNICNGAWIATLVISIVVVAIVKLVQLYLIFIVQHYVAQLRDEESAAAVRAAGGAFVPPQSHYPAAGGAMPLLGGQKYQPLGGSRASFGDSKEDLELSGRYDAPSGHHYSDPYAARS